MHLGGKGHGCELFSTEEGGGLEAVKGRPALEVEALDVCIGSTNS